MELNETYIITAGKHAGEQVRLTVKYDSQPGKVFYAGYLVERPLTSVFLAKRDLRSV